MILLYYAYQLTSLADATVISFSCPVFTSIIACIFLKEKYSPWDALFTAFTITGVILIVRPPFLFGSEVVETDKDYSFHRTPFLQEALLTSRPTTVTSSRASHPPAPRPHPLSPGWPCLVVGGGL